MKPKICTVCGKEYYRLTSQYSTSKYCSLICKQFRENRRKEERLLAKKLAAVDKKLAKKAKPLKKKLAADLWKIISKKVRESSDRCYTCDKPLEWKDRSAGHFWSKGGHNAVRYELDNLRVQCVSCNSFRSGYLSEYSVRLRREIGDERFDALEKRAHTLHRYTSDELQEMIDCHNL